MVHTARNFHVIAKPGGPACNLSCTYCYYLKKNIDYPAGHDFQMKPEILEEFIKQKIRSQDEAEISFVWQGGEPTLLGLGFYEQVVALQKKHCPTGKFITNVIQTNATLLNSDWCRFFHDHRFLLGISIDGPEDIHNRFRIDKKGEVTFDRVMQGIELCREYRVEFNTLTVVGRHNSNRALEVYEFLKSIGSQFIQFIPLVLPDEIEGKKERVKGQRVTGATVVAEEYGAFLCDIFDRWVKNDVGNIFVQIFDCMLGIWFAGSSSLCEFSFQCGNALALEHNGELFSCDHFVTPEHSLGDICRQPMSELAGSQHQQRFGASKHQELASSCKECEVLFACRGGCPKDRLIYEPEEKVPVNYLCPGYKMFLRHIGPDMRLMSDYLAKGLPPSRIMET